MKQSLSSPFALRAILKENLRLIVFTLPIAAVWVAGALMFAPQASTEELVVVVATPMLLVTVLSRLSAALGRDTRPTAASSRQIWKMMRDIRVLRLIVLSINFIVLGFAALLAIPVYVLLGLEWAPLFGLISSVLLVVFGAGLFIVAFTGFALLRPGVLLAIIRVLRHRRRRGRDDGPIAAIRALLG